jgi:hypothetical protein
VKGVQAMVPKFALTTLELRILQFAEGIGRQFQPGQAAASMADESITTIHEAAEDLVEKKLLRRPGHDSRGPVNYSIEPAGVDYLRTINDPAS